MKDLYLKRNQLCNLSKKLQIAKFDGSLSKERITELITEQDKVYKKYKFYDNYLKLKGKMK